MSKSIEPVSSSYFWQFIGFSAIGGIGGAFTGYLFGLPQFLKDCIFPGRIDLLQAFGLSTAIAMSLSVLAAVIIYFSLRHYEA
jgi:hypothetical protein